MIFIKNCRIFVFFSQKGKRVVVVFVMNAAEPNLKKLYFPSFTLLCIKLECFDALKLLDLCKIILTRAKSHSKSSIPY
jgi:hypothetical protein